MKAFSWIALPFLVATVPNIMADRDNNYYPGFTNPNLEHEMYWKDSINVLQDLNQFKYLYIKYHKCVWSEYGNGADEYENGCSGNGDEDHWYVGRTQCYRANAAFSLYGVLADGSNQDGDWSDSSNCNEHTYINSFFTNYGVEAFVDPLGIDSSEANSQCNSTKYGGNGYYHGDEHLDKMFEGYKSVTTGCSADGLFVLDQFEGAYCDGLQFLETVDNLADFNDAIETQKCVQVFNSYNERKLDSDDTVAGQILSKSTACSIREYPNDCPDPYGLLKEYTVALEKESKEATTTPAEKAVEMLPWFSFGFLVIASIMFVSAWYSHKRALANSKAKSLETGDAFAREGSNSSRFSAVSTLAGSLLSAKHRFQKYAEEDEYVVEGGKDVPAQGYNAPTPPSSSSDEEGGKSTKRPLLGSKDAASTSGNSRASKANSTSGDDNDWTKVQDEQQQEESSNKDSDNNSEDEDLSVISAPSLDQTASMEQAVSPVQSVSMDQAVTVEEPPTEPEAPTNTRAPVLTRKKKRPRIARLSKALFGTLKKQ